MLVKNFFIISLILIHPRTDHQMKNKDYEEVNLDIDPSRDYEMIHGHSYIVNKGENVAFLKEDCTCSEFVDQYGIGNCSREDTDFGAVICYVNLPANCSDLRKSKDGLFNSAEACKRGKLKSRTIAGTGLYRSGVSGSGFGGSGDDESEEAGSGDDESEEAESEDDTSEEAGSGDAESEEADSEDDESDDAGSRDDESEEAGSGDDESEEAGSEDDTSEEAGSGDAESEEAESEDDTPEEAGSGDGESEEAESEDDKSEKAESEPECHCNTFVNSHGLGNCKKHDDDFGSPSCFVNIPSGCNDLIESRINRRMFRSGEACRPTCPEADITYLLNDIVDINEADITTTWEECSKLCNTKYCHCNYWTWYKEEGICLVKTRMKDKVRSNLTISGNRKCGSQNVLNSAAMWTKHEKRHCYKNHGGEESSKHVTRHEEIFIRLDECKDKCKVMLTCEGISVQHGKEGENKTVCYLKQKINVDKCLDNEEWDAWILQRKCSDQEKKYLEKKNTYSGYKRGNEGVGSAVGGLGEVTSPNSGSGDAGSGGGRSGNAGSGVDAGSGQPNVIPNCGCGKVNQIPDPKYDPTLNYERCSITQDYARRISGGSKTIPNQYPFMTHIYLPDSMCGGTLISSKHIITANHCVAKYVEQKNFIWTNKSYIQLGGHNRKKEKEFLRYFIKDCKFPNGKGWNPHKPLNEPYEHDIAILVLKTYVKFTRNISPVCLPQPNEIIDHKVKVIAIGWGNICDNPKASSINSHELKHVQTELSDINSYRSIVKLPFNKITNFLTTFVPIIEGKYQATGTGDSGGPLIQRIKDTDHYKLIGDTSANLPLPNGTKVGVYGAIVPFVSWIKQTVATEPGSFICGN